MAKQPLLAVQVIRQHLTYLDETPFNQIDTKLLRRIKLAVQSANMQRYVLTAVAN